MFAALSTSFSASIVSIIAKPAAADTALPPDVGVVPPKNVLQIVVAGDRARERADAARQALAAGHDLGLEPVVIDREHLAGAAEAGLDLVGDQQDPARLAHALDRGPTTSAAARARRRPG